MLELKVVPCFVAIFISFYFSIGYACYYFL